MTIRFHPSPLAGGMPQDIPAAAGAQAKRIPAAGIRPALLAEGAAREALDALMGGGALAVTTGQQAGLFTGPLYGVLKALTAAAMAQELSARGRAHVAVFWVAGDDHDFAEVNHCSVLGADGRPVRIVLRERDARAPMLPVWREKVGDDGRRALDQLLAALPPGEPRDHAAGWLERCYLAKGADLAEAYARAMAELLGPFGVVVARGWRAELKTAARAILLDAARRAPALDQALAAEATRRAAKGDDVPVEVGQGLSLLMLETAEGRDRLKIVGEGRFETRRGGHGVSLKDLERVLSDEPEKLSGNVLLRPAMEAALFPSVGYCGGPGELAYLAQAGPVFEQLGVPRPARLARVSGFLVEAKVDKVLEKHGLAPGDFAQPEGALASRLAREQLPGELAAALASLRAAITERYAPVQQGAAGVDKTLERTVENARNQALVGTQEIEKKLVAALKRANEVTLQQVQRARDQLFPAGEPQERVLTVASFLARSGPAVLEVLHAAARDHARRCLEGIPGGA